MVGQHLTEPIGHVDAAPFTGFRNGHHIGHEQESGRVGQRHLARDRLLGHLIGLGLGRSPPYTRSTSKKIQKGPSDACRDVHDS